MAIHTSTDLLNFCDHSNPLFRTPLEYLIAIWNKLDQQRQHGEERKAAGQRWENPYSYIEVWQTTGDELMPLVFVRRHYVRFGYLTPFTCQEEDIRLDPFIREVQVGEKPLISWSRLIHDAMFRSCKPKPKTVHEFIKCYEKNT